MFSGAAGKPLFFSLSALNHPPSDSSSWKKLCYSRHDKLRNLNLAKWSLTPARTATYKTLSASGQLTLSCPICIVIILLLLSTLWTLSISQKEAKTVKKEQKTGEKLRLQKLAIFVILTS
jgi:hypothetical protein